MVSLDLTDLKILDALQKNGRITNVELAKRIGISAPPCLRRVRTLEETGVIEGYQALLNEKNMGFEVTGFAMVGLSSQAEQDLQQFEQQMASWPIVRESYMLSGEVDFILKCVAQDLNSFQQFIIQDLTTATNVDNVKTSLTIRKTKSEPRIPIIYPEKTKS